MELIKRSPAQRRGDANWPQARPFDSADGDAGTSYAAIAQSLERLIVNGRHAPGERLTEREVVGRFGCTNAAAREVFHILEMSGAIHLSSRRGARILDDRFARATSILETWHCLYSLLLAEVRATVGHVPIPPLSSVAGETPYERLGALRGYLATLGRLAGNEKLASMLARIAMHLFIIAPDRTDALFPGSRDEQAG